jgi:hypothetical protein
VIDNHERLESITSGIQSIVTAVGIVTGGWWEYHTFGAVGTVQKAELEIATLKQSAARQARLATASWAYIGAYVGGMSVWITSRIRRRRDQEAKLAEFSE